MKKAIFAVVFLFCVIDQSQAQWLSQNSPHGQAFASINFYNANVGWVCGSNGAVYRTFTGGSNWITTGLFTSSARPGRVRAVAQPEAARVYFIAETPNNSLGPTAFYFAHIIGTSTLSRQLQDYNHYNNLFFRDSTQGMLVGDNGVLRVRRPGSSGWFDMISGTSNNLRDGHMPTAQVGYVVGDGGTVRKTDGTFLITWRALNSTTSARLNGVWFTDAQTGYIVGDGGTALRTLDGGTSWTRITTGSAVNFNDVRFVSASTGFIVGELGTILVTTDGGVSWRAEPSNVFETLYSIAAAADGSNIWVTGDGGTVLKRGAVTLQAGAATKEAAWQVYPNPFSALLTVELPKERTQGCVLTVYDATGRIAQQEVAPAGIAKYQLNTSALSAGVYWLQVKSGQLLETRRLLRVE